MNTAAEHAQSPQQTFGGGKFLSFQLGREEYGIAILKVREIMGMVDITVLPRTPTFVMGVVNLRGRIVPVIDLRRRFGMEPTGFTSETCIVVVECGEDAEATLCVGCIVDSVSEVLTISPEHVEAMPRCARDSGDYIHGLAKLKDHVLILLDIDKVIADIDSSALSQGAAL